MKREDLVSDLAPFGDIGDDLKVADQGGKFTVKMTRDAKSLKIVIDQATSKIQCTWGTNPVRNFASLPAMLASEVFAHLRRWADAQRDLLLKEVPSADDLLPVHGLTHDKITLGSVAEVDTLLGNVERPVGSTEILLVDGPAGIGKTSLIEQLALRRAEQFRTTSRPVILHVKSRGRVLSNLQDLMAFSLQTIRSQITYDQIPVLAKYGLVIIAIDGFDELADPNGYEMAWAQLGELVSFVRGKGTLILAGRDTFIGRSRLLKDVPALRQGVDVVNGVTLLSPTPEQARQWLKRHEWTDAQLGFPSISVLLEEGSFALRPVFLRILAKHVRPKEIKDKHERYLTPLLVGQMIEREAGLFGKAVQSVMNTDERQKFISAFLCEVAREMADSQVEALEASEIAWISEAALRDGKTAEIIALIRNRASVVAFFVNDERPGYKRFMHSYLLNYFLSLVVIEAIGAGEVPKFIRRNILGSEFLLVFADVAAESAITSAEGFRKFWDRASSLSLSYSGADRGIRNVGALALAALPAVETGQNLILREFGVDDAVVRGVCGECTLENLQISQLDIRGADLSLVAWTGGSIGSLVVDHTTRVSSSVPLPAKVVSADEDEIVGATEVIDWLDRHGRDAAQIMASGLATAALKAKPAYALLSRAARMRQYWLRADSDDVQANKIVSDPRWPAVSRVLAEHGYLREEVRQAAGRASKFYHIKHRESILAESHDDAALKKMLTDIEKLP